MLVVKVEFWVSINLIFFIRGLIFIFYFPLFYSNNINIFISMDNLSFFLVLLSRWLVRLIYLARERVLIKKNNIFIFSGVIFFLLYFLILSFLSNDLLLFYIFFEISLIPTFLLILGWGYQPERIQAGLYLLFYTLVASLPLLMGIFLLGDSLSSLRYRFLEIFNFNIFLYFSLVVAFLVKIPIFLVHLWLPKAHVEAPVSGSIILAGVLLKLGGYGLIRLIKVLILLNNFFRIWWVRIRLFGGRLISLNCLRQVDLKSLIAYSSVAHIGLVLGGLITLRFWGVRGCYLIIIAHGLCSSGLFCLANVSYERSQRRRIFINKGMLRLMPRLTLWWFLLCSSNMSAPPSLNLLGEIDLINRLVAWSWVTMILIFLLSFFRASYCFYLFAYSQHGLNFSGMYGFSSNRIREYLLLVLHWLPLNTLFFNRESFLI